jgi:hypothetical protein
MSNSAPPLIEEKNLSHAWVRAFLHIIDNPGKEISPLIVSITGFTNGIPEEDKDIREALDNCLTTNDKQKVHTVANTIFPHRVWKRSKDRRNRFFERYLKILPRIKSVEPYKNRRGLYFERLIAFGSGPHDGNQLEHIISEYESRPGVRRTMFQASIFDPGRDHVRDAQLPFPCLQHVSFVPQGNSLTLNAFYATQQIFEKAYGNYLGLCRLGDFIAHEMGLTFGRMNCFVGVAKLDTIGKTSATLTPLIQAARNALQPTTDEQTVDGI